ncbi:MAG: response regulator [Bacteroidales bacterium]|nr:response regulator [Bacteroidales bacterium]
MGFLNSRKILSVFISAIFISGLCLGSGYTDNIQSRIEEYKNLIGQYEAQGNKTELARYYNLLANTYYSIDVKAEAIKYYILASEVNEAMGNENALKTLYFNIGVISDEQQDYQSAIKYYEKSLAIHRKRKDLTGEISDLLNIARSFQSLKYYAESNSRAELANQKAAGIEQTKRSNEMNSLLAESCKILADNYDALGNSQKFTEYNSYYTAIQKQIAKQEREALVSEKNQAELQARSSQEAVSSMRDTLGEVLEQNREMQYQNLLLNQQNELNEKEKARKEAENQQLKAREETRRTQIIALIVLLGFFILIVFLVLMQSRAKKKANRLLMEQNNEIERQKNKIGEQHELAEKQKKRITDSILYAQRIQKAVLPQEEFFSAAFNDYFILYKPKDIVSGDFYWTAQKGGTLILAVADCTGHGVPGAFMSMLGVAYLNEIVNKIVINQHISNLNADDILNQLREMIITSLHQTGDITEPKDGMDIALCLIDLKNRKLQYAGANNPLYIIRNKEIIEYKADKMPVSYHQKKDISFSRISINWETDDRIYLFSDGYVDQFGGDKGLKFMSRRFKDTLLSIHTHSMKDQARLLDKAFDDWRGEHTQLDDILIIGIRLGAEVSPAKSAENIDWSDKTILIAEDTDVNYFLMAAVLKQTRVNLVRVKDGLEAVEFVKNNEVDLILMDINMPGMNGYDATKIIKQHRKDIPVIIQTAMHLDEDDREAFQVGADDYIAKPIDLKTFIKKIGQLLQ